MQKYDVIVVGGGAAGLACAVRLADKHKKLHILVVDGGERLGKKLAATGNGQGNVTNRHMGAEYYFGGNLPLVEKLTCSKESLALERSLFGMILSADENGRVYPGGKQASSLVDSLLFDCNRLGVTTMLSTKVTDIAKGFTLTLSDGQKLGCRYVVFCVGGKAQKQFKTDGSSYALVEKFGHTVTPLYPSLVQLKTEAALVKTLKGIRVNCHVKALHKGKVVAERRGDVIFTEYGVSGNAIFELSPYIVDKKEITLSLDLLPQVEEGVVQANVKRKKALGYAQSELLGGTLHNQLGRAVMKGCATDDAQKVAYAAKHFTLPVTGTLGFDYAQVTKGGIDMKGITDELESKWVKNLFFAGEVLDVDGQCGGYNLHWAFCSAEKVAQTIAERERV